MNIKTVPANYYVENISNFKQHKALLFLEKQTITATLEAISNKSTIFKTDAGVLFQSTDIIKGEIGEEFTFTVVKNDKKGIVLRSLNGTGNNDKIIAKQLSQEELLELLKQHNMASTGNMFSTSREEQMDEKARSAKLMEAKSRINRELTYAEGNLTQSVINELIASGLSLEKIDLYTLNTAIAEAENNVHTSEKNLKSIESALVMADKAKDINDSQIAGIIKSQKPLTLKNIYNARYSSEADVPTSETEHLPDEVWESLRDGGELEKTFDREDIDFNNRNLSAAKFLINNELPVTKENIEKFNYLKNIDSQIDHDLIMRMATKNIKENKSPLDIDFLGENEKIIQKLSLLKNYKDIINELPDIKHEKIDILYKTQQYITLQNLRGQQDNSVDMAYIPDDPAISEKIITSKRQLAEIQLKLTKEAAVRLAGKNINIETMPLEEALDELRMLENTVFSKSLRTMGVPETRDNVTMINSLYNKIDNFKNITNNVYANIMQKNVPDEFNTTASEIDISIKFAKTLRDIENFATVVNTKYGDSFAKVKDGLIPILASIGLEASERNMRAASILSRNGMDITMENVVRVMTIDAKLDRFRDTLHPNIAASMIKDGFDPSKVSIDKALEYIDNFGGKYGEDIGDKISRYIMEMDKDESLDGLTRSGMISIYRMLNTVRRNDSAAIGLSLKNGINITLGNLLEAASHYEKTGGRTNGIDVSIDDDKISLDLHESDIKSSLNKALLEYNRENIRAFTENAAPDKLSHLMKQHDVKMMAISDIIDELKSITVQQEHYAKISADEIVREIINSSSDVMHWLNQNQIPLTLYNISAAKSLKNPFFISDELEEIIEAGKDSGMDRINGMGSMSDIDYENTDLTGIRNGSYNQSEIYEKLENLKYSHNNKIPVEKIMNTQKAINFQNQIFNNGIQIPLKMHNKICGLNVFVLNENLERTESQNIYMSLKTENLGSLQIFVNTSDKETVVKITAEYEEYLSKLAEDEPSLLEGLSGRFPNARVIFGTEECADFMEIESRNDLFMREVAKQQITSSKIQAANGNHL